MTARAGDGSMLQAEGAEAPVKVEFDNFEHGFPEGFGPGGWGHLAYAVGIAFAAFQLYVAAWNVLPSQVVRGVHVGFLMLMTFGLIGNFTAKSDAGRAIGWLIGAVGFLCGLYQWIFYADLIARDGDPTQLDLVGRQPARGPDLRRHAAADGAGAAADVRRLHPLLVLRPVSARAVQSSRL